LASIKKKNGKWEVRYDAGYDGQGARIQKFKGGFIRKEDAEAFYVETQNSLNKGLYINPDKIFIFEYLNQWLESQENTLSPTTYSGYEVNIRCHINPYIGGIRLQELRAMNIREMYGKLQKDRKIKVEGEQRDFKKLSPKSILYVHRVLSKALEDAFKDDLIPKNSAKAVTPPKVSKYKAKFLAVDQIRIMLDKFKNDDLYLPVYLSVVLGLRRGEALGLTWKHIDWENKVIMIRQELTMAGGKPILLEEVKTEDSERDIVVTDRVISVLKQYKKKQLEQRAALGNKYFKSDFICTWCDGKLFNPSHISRSFKLRMKAYGLPDLRFHDLRHTNGSLMIGQNMPLKGASERLGHSSIVITNDFYGHIERKVQEEIAENIDKTIWGNM